MSSLTLNTHPHPRNLLNLATKIFLLLWISNNLLNLKHNGPPINQGPFQKEEISLSPSYLTPHSLHNPATFKNPNTISHTTKIFPPARHFKNHPA